MIRFSFSFILSYAVILFAQNSYLRVNQLGYLPRDAKVSVFMSKKSEVPQKFLLVNALTGKSKTFTTITSFGAYGSFPNTCRLDFTAWTRPGRYYIMVGETRSAAFSIGEHVYNGTADFLLQYMRQQRCGYNPFLKDSCHTHDGYIIYHPEKDSQYIDVRGGWHDASDYLQYVTTSANAVYQMLFAYQHFPGAYGDEYDANGNPGKNGIPDVLDEAKWGLDWLSRMNPAPGEMYNQIADDRDHRGFRLPTLDTTSYGRGLERPVYFVTGKPQGVFKYKNRSTGVASTAAKFASAFALGADILQSYYPAFASELRAKSVAAYQFGKSDEGICQTAPCVSPYFYEEDNYTDDMELAAAQLAISNNDSRYFTEAAGYGKSEPVTPWMGADTARHYQWYPFLNLGHYQLAKHAKNYKPEFINYLRTGLLNLRNKGNNAFLFGIPYIWCSNNLVAAAITQAHLYRNLTGDTQFYQMETALRDWLFGCNPWGTGMIYGLPAEGDTPADPHSALSLHHGYPLNGGLVDGPVYTAIFKRLLGIKLSKEDTYKEFQSDLAVYHDDYGDYSTNEPTMDGTASLSYYFAAMQANTMPSAAKNTEISHGGIIRMDTTAKEIYLCFTGNEYAEGAASIMQTLQQNRIKASFFFTGEFYRNQQFRPIVQQLKKAGHYLGAHSDKHLLYCDWKKRDSLLVTREQFEADIMQNYKEMAAYGIATGQAAYFMPPYEWYNSAVSRWTNDLGLRLINMTPRTYTNADYSIPSMGNGYRSSSDILRQILEKADKDPVSLQGALLLVHIGTHPERTDKFYLQLPLLIKELRKRGFRFKSL